MTKRRPNIFEGSPVSLPSASRSGRETTKRSTKAGRFRWLIFLVVGWISGVATFWWAQNEINREDEPAILTETWEGIDDLAAHPQDPDKPDGVEGVSDEEIASLSQEDVDLLLSDEIVELAMLSDEPRHSFEIGRVAFVHDDHELAFEMLSLAAESGSAPAYMYVADFFADDLPTALEYAQASVDLGFEPAHELVATIEEAIGTTNSGTLEADYDDALRNAPHTTTNSSFDGYHQPELLEGMFERRLSLHDLSPRVPSSAPDFIANAEGETLVNQMVATLYACHLAVALGEKGKEEVSVYLPEGSPRLAQLVDANVASTARIRLTTEDMLLINKGVTLIKRLSMAKPVFEGGKQLFRDGLSFESLAGVSETVFSEWLQQDKRSKSTEDFSNAVKDQAMLDAIRLQDAYYLGDSDQVRSVYQGLSDFILKERKND